MTYNNGAATTTANETDPLMCGSVDVCVNMSWTHRLRPEYSYDQIHFIEPIYRLFNEELLDQLGYAWPEHYERLERDDYLNTSIPEDAWATR